MRIVSDLSSSDVTIPVSTRPSVGNDQRRLILLGDQAAGIENIRQQVLGVRAVGAREIGPDRVADAVELVTLLACFGENCAAELLVGFVVRIVRKQLAMVGDELGLVGSGWPHLAPDLGQQLVDGGVVQVAQLAHEVGRQIGCRNLLFCNGLQQLRTVRRAGRECGQRRAFLFCRKRRIDFKNLGRRLGVVVLRQPGERFSSQRWLTQQALQRGGQPWVAGIKQCLERSLPGLCVGTIRCDQLTQLAHGLRVAEFHAQRRGLGTQSLIAVAGNLAEDGGPFGGRRNTPAAGEGAVDPAQDDQLLVGIVRRAKCPHQQRNCRPCVQTADAPHHELAQLRNCLPHDRPKASARSGSASASGSAAYQYISGRL